jgi:hypothetical protein
MVVDSNDLNIIFIGFSMKALIKSMKGLIKSMNVLVNNFSIRYYVDV